MKPKRGIFASILAAFAAGGVTIVGRKDPRVVTENKDLGEGLARSGYFSSDACHSSHRSAPGHIQDYFRTVGKIRQANKRHNRARQQLAAREGSEAIDGIPFHSAGVGRWIL